MLQVLLGIGLNMICVLARLTLLVTAVTNAQKASLDFHHVLQVSFSWYCPDSSSLCCHNFAHKSNKLQISTCSFLNFHHKMIKLSTQHQKYLSNMKKEIRFQFVNPICTTFSSVWLNSILFLQTWNMSWSRDKIHKKWTLSFHIPLFWV